jgi:hypothetical protein
MMEMAMKKVIFAAMLLGTTTFANAENTNFSYTTLGVSGGATTLGTPLCSTNVCFSSFGNAGVNGSYQFNDNTLDWLVLTLSSSAGVSNGKGYKLSESDGAAGLNFVKAISNTVDIGAGIESLSSTIQLCSGSNCVSTNDTGVGYGVSVKGWLNDAKNLTATVLLDTYKYSENTSNTNGYSLALGYYADKNNELSLSYGAANNNSNTSSTVMAAYTYHFYASPENKIKYTTSEVKPEAKPQVEPSKAIQSKASTPATDKLIELNSMRQQGLINDSEYATKKKAILDAM